MLAYLTAKRNCENRYINIAVMEGNWSTWASRRRRRESSEAQEQGALYGKGRKREKMLPQKLVQHLRTARTLNAFGSLISDVDSRSGKFCIGITFFESLDFNVCE